MEFDPHAVEIFADASSGKTKYRLCVGFAIGEHLYYMKKFGLIDSEPDVVHPSPKHLDACRGTYDHLEATGELAIPIFGYDLGEPYDYDDNGEPIGDWPELGTATIHYHDKFLMPGGTLPEGHTHRRRMRWFGL
jgi:hypothetical protein